MKFSFLTWLVLLSIASENFADGWPQFRGPGGDGVSSAKNLPLKWSSTDNIAWKTEIPGKGRSSPIVFGDRIWVTTAVETNPRKVKEGNDPVTAVDRVELGLVCLDRATGKKLYHTMLFRYDNPPSAHIMNSFATPTPVIEAGRIYCEFGAMGTACVDAETGKVLWQNRVIIDHQLAPGSSPVLWKNLLILVRDGRDQQFVAALDKNTGKIVWKTDRPPIEAKSGNAKKSFSTPVVVETGGRAQIIAPCAHWFVSCDAATGRELWRVKHGTGFSIGPRPVAGHGMVYALTGMTKQMWAIKTDGNGDVTATHVAWKATSQMPMLASPLLLGKEIYTVSDQGLMTCLNALTGEELGAKGLGGPCASSPFFADGRIYVFGQKGKAVVLKAGKELEVLAENELGDEPLFASPAVADGALYVRTDSNLYCIGKK